MMRPDGGTMEEMQAWNARLNADLLERMGLNKAAQVPEMADHSADQDSTSGLDLDNPEHGSTVLESAPSLDAEPDTPGLAETPPDTLPSSDPLPKPVAPPVRARNPALLPYPFNTMKPEDVPEEVWERARLARAGD